LSGAAPRLGWRREGRREAPVYVYERFFGGGTNQYPGRLAESDRQLPIRVASWHNRLDYTPSFDGLLGDYLLRFETALLIPMWEAISFRVSIVNLYDSTPAEGTDENSLATLIGLSYGF